MVKNNIFKSTLYSFILFIIHCAGQCGSAMVPPGENVGSLGVGVEEQVNAAETAIGSPVSIAADTSFNENNVTNESGIARGSADEPAGFALGSPRHQQNIVLNEEKILHLIQYQETGRCPEGKRPCHFSGGLCWKGDDCNFCHICPPPKRKSKHQRDLDKRREKRAREKEAERREVRD